MLPRELIRLILEFHNPHMTAFHSHGNFYCLVCWSYNPQKLFDQIVSKDKWERPVRETQALPLYVADFMLDERLFKPRASRNKCATKESQADPGWKKIPSRLLASQVKNETRRECKTGCVSARLQSRQKSRQNGPFWNKYYIFVNLLIRPQQGLTWCNKTQQGLSTFL